MLTWTVDDYVDLYTADELFFTGTAAEIAPIRSVDKVAIGGGELDTAERAARQLIERAPYRESGHRLLMETLEARGLSLRAS